MRPPPKWPPLPNPPPCANAVVVIGVVAAARASDVTATIIMLRIESLLESEMCHLPERARTKRPGATEFYSRRFLQPLAIATLLRRKASVLTKPKLRRLTASPAAKAGA